MSDDDWDIDRCQQQHCVHNEDLSEAIVTEAKDSKIGGVYDGKCSSNGEDNEMVMGKGTGKGKGKFDGKGRGRGEGEGLG